MKLIPKHDSDIKDLTIMMMLQLEFWEQGLLKDTPLGYLEMPLNNSFITPTKNIYPISSFSPVDPEQVGEVELKISLKPVVDIFST